MTPSRPHLAWQRTRTIHLHAAVNAPVNCLAASVVAIWVLLARGFLGTDGSEISTVAAFAVVIEGTSPTHSRGVDGEDQPPHRAEVDGLCCVMLASLQLSAVATLTILLEFKAATRAFAERRCCKRTLDARRELERRGWCVAVHWVPNHDKDLLRGHPLDADSARRLDVVTSINDAARGAALHRAGGSRPRRDWESAAAHALMISRARIARHFYKGRCG